MTAGPRQKSAGCVQCPLHGTGFGFVPDKWSPSVKVGVLKLQPVTAEVQNQQNCPFEKEDSWKEFLKTSSLKLSDIGFANILRCKTPIEKLNKNLYLRAALACRQYDSRCGNEKGRLVENVSSLLEFNPNAFIITYDLKSVALAVAHKIFIRRAFEIAEWYAGQGYRPLILMGEDSSRLINPELFKLADNYERDVNFKAWVGHHWLQSWPYGKTNNLIQIKNKKGFLD